MDLRDSSVTIEQWFSDNPFAQASLLVTIGILLILYGTYSILTGKANVFWGRMRTGLYAWIHGWSFVIAGVYYTTYGIATLLS